MSENLLFIDCESFFDSRAGYDLRNLSIPEYVRDEKFKLHGIGLSDNDLTSRWLNEQQFVTSFAGLGWIDKYIFVGHNIKFDGFILAEKYGIKPLQFRDTLAMARAVLGKKVESYSLRSLAEYYGLPAKGEMKVDGARDLSPEQEKELSEYCLHDVWLCREIYKRLEPEFPKDQYPLLDQTIRMFVEPKLELNVPLLAKTAENEKEQKRKLFEEMGIDKKIFSSNQKFTELLKEKGYEVPTKTSPSTGKSIPALALGDPEFLDLCESEDEALKKLCQARVEAKSTLMETRCEKLSRIGQTGPWPFDVEFSGAAQTHRYSGGGNAGGNPQNFTRDSALREAVQAPKGFSLVVGDFANIEMRLVAYLSNDRGLIDAIENGEDIYCTFASAFYGRKITKDDVNERRFGKTAILGLGYGMGPTKFQRTVRLQTGQKITIEEARKAVRLYRGLYYKVPALWKELDNRIKFMTKEFGLLETPQKYPVHTVLGGIELPSGLKIQYSNLRKDGEEWVYDGWGKKGERVPTKLYGGKLTENICQALASELCKEVMRKFGDQVVGQCHDEILLISDNPIEDRAELEAAMTTPPSWLPNLRLEAEVNYGQSWGACK